MALNENALITWELAENMLHLLTEDQETVEFLINGASQQAERIAGRPLAYRTVDTYMPGSGTEMLFLPLFPVYQIANLRVDPARVFGGDTVVTDYDLDADAGIVYLFDSVFPGSRKTVKVQYSGGYSRSPSGNEPEVPTDLQSAILEVVKWNFGRFQGQKFGIKGENADGISISYEITVPLNARQIIEGYRCHRL